MQFWSHADAGPLWNCKKCRWILCSSRSGNCGVAFGLATYSMHSLCEWSYKLFFCYKRRRNSWKITCRFLIQNRLKSFCFLRYGQLVALLSTGYIEAGTRCYFFSSPTQITWNQLKWHFHDAMELRWSILKFLYTRRGLGSVRFKKLRPMEARCRLFQIQKELRAKKVTHTCRVFMWQRCNMYIINDINKYIFTHHAYVNNAALSHIVSWITRHRAKGMHSHLYISSRDISIKASMASEFGVLRVWPSDLFDV